MCADDAHGKLSEAGHAGKQWEEQCTAAPVSMEDGEACLQISPVGMRRRARRSTSTAAVLKMPPVGTERAAGGGRGEVHSSQELLSNSTSFHCKDTLFITACRILQQRGAVTLHVVCAP